MANQLGTSFTDMEQNQLSLDNLLMKFDLLREDVDHLKRKEEERGSKAKERLPITE